MKQLLSLLTMTVFFLSCNSNNHADKNQNEDTTETITDNTKTEAMDIIGSYVGSFGDNKITVIINKAQNDSLEGRSIVGGNDRIFVGSYSIKGKKIIADAKEPGDDVNDGRFVFEFSSKEKNILSGNWTPFRKDKEAKNFSLERKSFAYKTDVGDYPQASQRLLVAADVENLTKWELSTMRNEIFARHGYCFKKKDMRQQFEMYDWYVPATVSIVDQLTDIEEKNIKLIKHYEKYAVEFSDEWGR